MLRYGNADSLKGYEAAAEILPLLMTRGTKNLTRQQIQDELDKNRATLVGQRHAPARPSSPSRPSGPTCRPCCSLLRQILREPTLPADEFDVLRRRSLASLEEQLTDPGSLAITRVRRLVSPYAKDDVRYVPTIEEEIERYTAVTRDQVQKLYDGFLGSQAGELAIVGDFDPAENTKILQEAFSGWTAKESYARIPSDLLPGRAGRPAGDSDARQGQRHVRGRPGVSAQGVGRRLPGGADRQLRVRRRFPVVAAGRSRAAEGRTVVRRRLVRLVRRAGCPLAA